MAVATALISICTLQRSNDTEKRGYRLRKTGEFFATPAHIYREIYTHMDHQSHSSERTLIKAAKVQSERPTFLPFEAFRSLEKAYLGSQLATMVPVTFSTPFNYLLPLRLDGPFEYARPEMVSGHRLLRNRAR